jgi:hypothetical protein
MSFVDWFIIVCGMAMLVAVGWVIVKWTLMEYPFNKRR